MRISALLLFIALFPPMTWAENPNQLASFKEKYNRYPAPYDIFAHMQRLVPKFNRFSLSRACQQLGKENAAVLGAIMPLYGQPLEDSAGALFIMLYKKCLAEAIDAGFAPYSEDIPGNSKAVLGEEILAKIASALHKNLQTPADFSSLLHEPWKTLSPGLKKDVMRRLVLYSIGPTPVLLRLHYVGTDNAFRAPLENLEDLADFIEAKWTDKGAAAPDIYKMMKNTMLLLRLGPVLVN